MPIHSQNSTTILGNTPTIFKWISLVDNEINLLDQSVPLTCWRA